MTQSDIKIAKALLEIPTERWTRHQSLKVYYLSNRVWIDNSEDFIRISIHAPTGFTSLIIKPGRPYWRKFNDLMEEVDSNPLTKTDRIINFIKGEV